MSISLTPELCLAGRALTKLDRQQVASTAAVSEKILADFEDGIAAPGPDELDSLRAALEHFGVEFLPEEKGSGVGLRLKFDRQETRQLSGWEGEGGLAGEDEVP